MQLTPLASTRSAAGDSSSSCKTMQSAAPARAPACPGDEMGRSRRVASNFASGGDQRTRRRSTHIGDTLLGFRFGGRLGPHRELKHRRLLVNRDGCQKHQVAVGKLERVVMDIQDLLVDLPENRGVVANRLAPPAQKDAMSHRKSLRKSDFRAGQQADRHARNSDIRKATSPGAEVARNELIANRRGSRAYVL